jgi:hypothetical protein
VNWESFARFWAQVVRSTINTASQSNVEVRVNRSGDQANVTVDAQTPAGAFLNSLTMQVNVVAPDSTTQTVKLAQVAPGRYAGTFTPATEGAYLLRAAGTDPTQPAGTTPAVAQTAGWVLSYSPEYLNLTPNPDFLTQLAALANGHAVGPSADEIYLHDLAAPRATARPAWPLLLLIAALLLPVDIAVRRLVIPRSDFERAWRRLQDGLRGRRPASVLTPERAEGLSSLFAAKNRASPETRPPPAPPAVVPPAGPRTTRPTAAEPAAPKPAARSRAKPASREAETAAPAATGTSAALLAKKRAREKKE